MAVDNAARIKTLTACASALIAIALVTTLLRLWTRFFVVKRPRWDDLPATLAFLCYVAVALTGKAAIAPFAEVYKGNFTHLELAITYSSASSILYIFSTTFLKVSLTLYLLRYAPYRHILLTVLAFTVLFSTAMLIANLTTCGPRAYFFPLRPCPAYKTWRNLNRAWGASNAATDLLFPTLSAITLRRAKLGRGATALGWGLVGLGCVACTASIVRMAELVGLAKAAGLAGSLMTALYTQLEVGVGVVCANCACLWPLFRQGVRWGRRVKVGLEEKPEGVEAVGAKKWPRVHVLDVALLPDVEVSATRPGSQPRVLWRLSSAMYQEEERKGIRDWREDRITPDEEIEILLPPQVFLTSVLTVEQKV